MASTPDDENPEFGAGVAKYRRFVSANGRHGGKGRRGPAMARLHPVLRYGAAFGITFLAAAMVGAVDLALSFPPFLLFAMAAGLSWVFFGFGPCVLSITLAALASDFFFVQPQYELSLNSTTVRLASVYAAGAAVSRMAAYWTAKHGGTGDKLPF